MLRTEKVLMVPTGRHEAPKSHVRACGSTRRRERDANMMVILEHVILLKE